MNEYALIIDIAARRDYTAFMIYKDSPQIERGNALLKGGDRVVHFRDIVFLEMMNGRRYKEITARTRTLVDHADVKNNVDLLVDGREAGSAVIEMMQDDGLYPIPILSGGGEQPRWHYAEISQVFGNTQGKLRGAQTLKYISVPKKDLMTAGQAVLQQRRVGICQSPFKPHLIKQLEAFKKKTNKYTGNDQFEAEEESDHDDFVTCFCIGEWWFMNRKDSDVIPEREIVERQAVGYDPLDY